MITIDTQIHGYRQGHELLASSASLPKADQAIVDRLSDVAGPLRPGENFESYLSAYPLPSGHQYILARTWQDTTAPRAGCVRTLSLLIPSSAWMSARGLKAFFDLLDPSAFPTAANPISLSETAAVPLPPSPPFRASELLEALFLEEPKPVALFEAPAPELIALRLLSALWPSLRNHFAVSTFALSPRKIEGRSFDLVFSPKDARPRFSDWSGRRIDARIGQGPRHRWTNEIVDRVFNQPIPRLLGDRELRLIGADETKSASTLSASALRIALLWNELVAKLERSPSAALGLLDIANARMQGDTDAILTIQPALAKAASRAVQDFPAPEAWEFIGAMARKMHNARAGLSASSIASAAAMLAKNSPFGAIALLNEPDPQRALHTLVPAIADGLNRGFSGATERGLMNASPDTLVGLACADGGLAQNIVRSPVLIEKLARIIPDLEPSSFDGMREVMLPLLTEDNQLVAARPLLASLGSDDLMAEVRHLAEANGFKATSFIAPLVERARDLNVIIPLRNLLLTIRPSQRRDQFLRATLSPTIEDVTWLLDEKRLESETVQQSLLDILRASNARELQTLLAHEPLAQTILSNVSIDASDILLRAVDEAQLPPALHVETIGKLLSASSDQQKVDLAKKALDRCLSDHFGADEIATVTMFLGIIGAMLDGPWAVWRGLGRGIAPSIVKRNLVAFNLAPPLARDRLIASIDDLAQALEGRHSIELDQAASEACAQLLWDSRSTNVAGLLRASGRLLPMLLRERRAPVSAMIAASFPSIYRELAREDDVPELLKFVPFIDWDRCKAARRELVDAFLASSVWKPSDLALTACRSSDTPRILRRTAKSTGGEAYIERILAELTRLPGWCQEQTMDTIIQIQSDGAAKYSWRD